MNTQKIKSVLISALLSLLGAFVLIFIFSFISFKGDSPEQMRSFFGIASLLFGGILCGALPKLLFSDGSLSAYLITVGIYTALVLIASSLNGGDDELLHCFIKIALTLGASLLAFLAISKQKKKHSRKKRKRRH